MSNAKSEKMRITVTLKPRFWWRRFGLAGALVVWMALKAGAPTTWFYKAEIA